MGGGDEWERLHQQRHAELEEQVAELASALVGPVVFGGMRDGAQGILGKFATMEGSVVSMSGRMQQIEKQLESGLKIRFPWRELIKLATTLLGVVASALGLSSII